jgi:hypothetical protein
MRFAVGDEGPRNGGVDQGHRDHWKPGNPPESERLLEHEHDGYDDNQPATGTKEGNRPRSEVMKKHFDKIERAAPNETEYEKCCIDETRQCCSFFRV